MIIVTNIAITVGIYDPIELKVKRKIVLKVNRIENGIQKTKLVERTFIVPNEAVKV